MDIGTAKATADQRSLVQHHLIDVCEPSASFSVDRWRTQAINAIDRIQASGATPIVVGGTLLYVMALLEGLFDGPGADDAFRASAAGASTESLRAQLVRADPRTAGRLHPNDRRRTIRALEVLRLTGRSLTDLQEQWDRGARRPDTLLVVLNWSREAINRRINARVKRMLESGFVDEVRGLMDTGSLSQQAAAAIGYRDVMEHLAGKITLEDAAERIKQATRRLGKHQRSWLRRLLAGASKGTAIVVDADSEPMDHWPAIVADALESAPSPRASVPGPTPHDAR